MCFLDRNDNNVLLSMRFSSEKEAGVRMCHQHRDLNLRQLVFFFFPFLMRNINGRNKDRSRKTTTKDNSLATNGAPLKPALLRRISMKLKDVHAFSTTASFTLASALASSSTNRSSPRPYRSHGAARRPFFACVLSRRIRICKSVEHVAQRLQKAEFSELR